MAGIELRGVSRVFPGGGKGVDGLDLEVREGELLVLVGPSGSGKTTTLRVVAGLEEGREDLIIAGTILTIRTMELFGFSTLKVSDYGLLEGVLLDLIRNCEG